jgi:hypothetical protein
MIQFTQFLRPTGRPVDVEIERPGEIEGLADALVGIGAKFEVEVLSTGLVSFECLLHGDDDPLLSNQLCENGPEVPDIVDDLVKRAHTCAVNRGLIVSNHNVRGGVSVLEILGVIAFILAALLLYVMIGLLGSAGRRARRDEFYEINHEDLKIGGGE